MNVEKKDYKNLIQTLGVITVQPKGNSMLPFLKGKNQTVQIEKPLNDLEKYDVALYERADGTLVLHRVVEVLPAGYVFVGDSQYVTENVLKTQIIGVMTGVFNGNKFTPTSDKRYRKKVVRWYKGRLFCRLRKKWINFKPRLKGKLKRIFSKKGD